MPFTECFHLGQISPTPSESCLGPLFRVAIIFGKTYQPWIHSIFVQSMLALKHDRIKICLWKMTAIIAQVVQHTQAHRQSAEGQRRTLWRWVSILPRESCRQFVHKRHNQPLIRQSLAFESPSTFPWIVSICPWNLVKGLRHPPVPPKKTNERQNIRLTRFVFPERDRSASKLLQSWLQSPHLSTNVKAFSVPYIHLLSDPLWCQTT